MKNKQGDRWMCIGLHSGGKFVGFWGVGSSFRVIIASQDQTGVWPLRGGGGSSKELLDLLLMVPGLEWEHSEACEVQTSVRTGSRDAGRERVVTSDHIADILCRTEATCRVMACRESMYHPSITSRHCSGFVDPATRTEAAHHPPPHLPCVGTRKDSASAPCPGEVPAHKLSVSLTLPPSRVSPVAILGAQPTRSRE